jgi:hypothetical protein
VPEPAKRCDPGYRTRAVPLCREVRRQPAIIWSTMRSSMLAEAGKAGASCHLRLGPPRSTIADETNACEPQQHQRKG